MRKKILAILFISIFLIVSIGLISAAEDGDDAGNVSNPLKVKIVWNDSGNTTARPNQIMVNLLRDGKVVEFIRLNDSNFWNATFKTLDDGGNYSVKIAENMSNYSVSYNGSAESGFVINCTLKENPSNSSGNNSSGESNDTKDVINNKTNDDAKNKTNNNKVISNSTSNQTAGNGKNSTEDITINSTNSTPIKEESDNDTVIVKNSKRSVNNEEPQVTISKLRNTGLPIVALSLVAILGGYFYLRYRR